MNALRKEDFEVKNLGENRYPTPLKLVEENYRTDDDRVLYDAAILASKMPQVPAEISFLRAGPRKMIHFDSSKINVGIVTCGGLCPGLNDVIRAITTNCLGNYNVRNVYGFRYGYAGLTAGRQNETMSLTMDRVNHIHQIGGSVLGSSRGHQSPEEMVDTLVKFNISILFVIGGDGTMRGVQGLAEECERRKLDIAVVGVPKTVDNDISYVHRTFGLDTAVEEARQAIDVAHVEACGSKNGIGIVKLMGRHSGFIAANATLASGHADICLIPEVPLDLDALFAKIKARLAKHDHMVIVVAEGAGQELLKQQSPEERDASGNIVLREIGLFLRDKIAEYLKKENLEHSIKYVDPSYMIRSKPSNASDASFCLRLGNFAVHAGMSGKTNCLVGYWSNFFTLLPVKLAISKKKTVDLTSALWLSVMEITG
ncbi:MAG: ATP-dependent 6-phosphofructokinase [Spirochaetia bacterium]|nr:ATP-dependent 6-phosphofructokinase [Spirochaetia bacterium]